MELWKWTFILLLITAGFGIWLFVGYTYRLRPRYPLIVVSSHVISALVTVILFTVLLVRWIHRGNFAHGYEIFVLYVAYFVVLITFLFGMYLYVRYNLRKRGLTMRLLVAHLVMAALSFVAVVTGVAELSVPIHTAHIYPGTMYNYHKHHHDASS